MHRKVTDYFPRLGYACINLSLDATTSRTARLATIEKKGIQFLKDLILKNIDDLKTILLNNAGRGILFYRISSDLIPHITNPKLSTGFTLDFARKKLSEAGAIARKYNMRLTFHPGQFTLLSSENEKVTSNSIRDIVYHADVLVAMGCTPGDGSVIILHGGGTYGDKKSAIGRIKSNYYKIPEYARRYIAFENDEKSYSPDDLLPICGRTRSAICDGCLSLQVYVP